MKFRKLIVVGTVLVLAIASVGVVNAQSGRPGNAGPKNGPIDRGRGVRIAMNLLDILANEIGMEPQEIIMQMRDGTTLAEVIANSGHDVDVVGEAVIAEATARIQDAVENGNLPQENADRLIEGLQTRWDDFLNFEIDAGLNSRFQARAIGQVRATIGEAIGEATGLELDVIRAQIQGGMTPSEVIETNGGDVDTVIADVVAQLTNEIETAVANGNLSQDVADRLLENLEQHVTDVINGTLMGRFGEFRRGGRPGRPGFGGFLNDPGNDVVNSDA